MRQVFTDDVVIDTSEAGGDVVHGADEFMTFLQDALGEAVTVHQGHMPEIELTSDTTATGIWALQRHRDLAQRHAPRRLRPLPRDVREGARRLADASPRRLTRLHADFVMPERSTDVGRRGDRRRRRDSALALADRCAARGMDVALLDLDGERAATEAARVAETHGVETLALTVDVADAASVEAARPPPSTSASASPTSSCRTSACSSSARSRRSPTTSGVGCSTSTSPVRPGWPGRSFRCCAAPSAGGWRSPRRRRSSIRPAASARTRRASSPSGASPRPSASSSPTTASACR